MSEAVDGRGGSAPRVRRSSELQGQTSKLPAPNGLCSAFGKEWIARKKIAIKEAIVRKDEEAEISAPQLDELAQRLTWVTGHTLLVDGGMDRLVTKEAHMQPHALQSLWGTLDTLLEILAKISPISVGYWNAVIIPVKEV